MREQYLLVVATTMAAHAALHAGVLLRLPTPRERILAVAVLFPAVIVGVTLVVGWGLHTYRPVPVLLGTAALDLTLALWAWRPARRGESTAALVELGRSIGATLREVARAWPVRIVALATAPLVALRVLLAFRLPMFDYDGLYYHLVTSATWVQRGAVVHVPHLPIYADVYPANGEVLAGWTVLFRGDVALADLAQLPMLLLGGLAVVVAARLLAVDRSWAVVAGLLFISTPAALAQVNTAYVDVSATGPLVAGFVFLLAAAADARGPHTPARLAVAGTALGLAVGAKSSNLTFLLPAAVVVAGILVGPRLKEGVARRWGASTEGDRPDPATALHRSTALPGRARRGAGPVLLAAVAFALPLLVFGGFWYLRTWAEYGNPVHPFDAAVGPVTLFEGDAPVSSVIVNQIPPTLADDTNGAVRAIQSWLSEPTYYGYDQRLGGLGLVFTYLMVPALVLGAVEMWQRSRLFVLVFVLPLTLTIVLQPAVWWARYTLWLVAPGAVALAFFCGLAATTAGRRAVAVLVSGAAVLSAFFVLNRTPVDTGLLALPDTLRYAHSSALAESDPPVSALEAPYAGALGLPDGARVAALEGTLNHPFAVIGQELQRRLVLLPTPESPDLVGLERSLERSGATHLYVPAGSIEATVAVGAPDRFRAEGPPDPAGYQAFTWVAAGD